MTPHTALTATTTAQVAARLSSEGFLLVRHGYGYGDGNGYNR